MHTASMELPVNTTSCCCIAHITPSDPHPFHYSIFSTFIGHDGQVSMPLLVSSAIVAAALLAGLIWLSSLLSVASIMPERCNCPARTSPSPEAADDGGAINCRTDWKSRYCIRMRGRSTLVKYNLPPGRMGWPLIGETLELIAVHRTSDPEPFAQTRRARYGSAVFCTHLLGRPTIFSTDPDVNRFVMQNEGRLFVSSYPGSLTRLLGRGSLLLTASVVEHKQLYGLVASALKHETRVFSDIDAHVRSALAAWPAHPHIIHIQEEAKKITFTLSVKQLLSADPGPWTERLRQQYLLLIDGFFSLPINLPGTTYSKALHARSSIAKSIRQLVALRREKMNTALARSGARNGDVEKETWDGPGELAKSSDMDQIKRDPDDLLAALLEKKMGDDQIVDMVISLLVAGYETTSIIMTLAVKFLTDCPQALEQLQAEHMVIKKHKNDTNSGDRNMINWSDYKCSMTFTHCVINETLRLGNVVGGVFRKALQDVEMQGFTIPKGWTVFTSFRAVHFDEATYKDAAKFDPWRWLSSVPSTLQSSGCNNVNTGYNSKNPSTSSLNNKFFSPFGGGPRFCPGHELARVEIAIFLYHLTTQFSWQAAEADEIIFFPTTRMVKRLPVTVERLE